MLCCIKRNAAVQAAPVSISFSTFFLTSFFLPCCCCILKKYPKGQSMAHPCRLSRLLFYYSLERHYSILPPMRQIYTGSSSVCMYTSIHTVEVGRTHIYRESTDRKMMMILSNSRTHRQGGALELSRPFLIFYIRKKRKRERKKGDNRALKQEQKIKGQSIGTMMFSPPPSCCNSSRSSVTVTNVLWKTRAVAVGAAAAAAVVSACQRQRSLVI